MSNQSVSENTCVGALYYVPLTHNHVLNIITHNIAKGSKRRSSVVGEIIKSKFKYSTPQRQRSTFFWKHQKSIVSNAIFVLPTFMLFPCFWSFSKK